MRKIKKKQTYNADYRRDYYRKNRKKILAYQAHYFERNAEKMREYWRERNELRKIKRGGAMPKLKIEREEYVRKLFKFDAKLLREMERICTLKGITLNKFVDICVRYALSNIDTSSPEEER